MIINRLGLPYLSFLCSICTWAQDNKVSHPMEIFHMAFGKEYIAHCADNTKVIVSKRPNVKSRLFVSDVVEKKTKEIKNS